MGPLALIPAWVWKLLGIAVLIGGFAFYFYEKGIAHQVAIDTIQYKQQLLDEFNKGVKSVKVTTIIQTKYQTQVQIQHDIKTIFQEKINAQSETTSCPSIPANYVGLYDDQILAEERHADPSTGTNGSGTKLN